MDANILKGKWKQMVGDMKRKWSDLTDDDWKHVEGDRDKFVGKLQERYGYAKDRAGAEVDEFLDNWDTSNRRVS
jgi:uncharacterized protein YjbJ (UPF0337 family)